MAVTQLDQAVIATIKALVIQHGPRTGQADAFIPFRAVLIGVGGHVAAGSRVARGSTERIRVADDRFPGKAAVTRCDIHRCTNVGGGFFMKCTINADLSIRAYAQASARVHRRHGDHLRCIDASEQRFIRFRQVLFDLFYVVKHGKHLLKTIIARLFRKCNRNRILRVKNNSQEV